LTGASSKPGPVFAATLELLGQSVGEGGIGAADIARHRSDVIVEYGLPPAPVCVASEAKPIVEPDNVDEHFLEAEIIALYW